LLTGLKTTGALAIVFAWLILIPSAQPKAYSSLTSFVYESRVSIDYVDINQHVNQLLWTGTQWVNQDLTVAAGTTTLAAPGSAVAELIDGNGPHIIYVDTNQHVNQLFWTGAIWINDDVTADAGSAAPVSPGTGLTTVIYESRVSIDYVDINQHVNQLLWTGTQWVNQDLTVAAGTATLASSGSAVANLIDSNGPHIVYIDTNQHVNQLMWTGAIWLNDNLTTDAGTIRLAAADSALTTMIDNAGPHVLYIDTNQHVNQLMWTSSGWLNDDLTADAGSTNDSSEDGDLSGFVYESRVSIDYVDINQHVNQLLWTGTQWVNQDLTTAAAPSPLAALDSGITNVVDSNGPHLFYVDTNQHINQLTWTGTIWSNTDLTAGGQGHLVTSVRTIRGQVLAGGTGVQGVNISLSGTTAAGTNVSLSTITDSNGTYSLSVPTGGTYTVALSLAGYTFSPASQTFSNVSGSQTAQTTTETNSTGGSQDSSLTCGQVQPEYLGSVPDDTPTALPIKVAGLSSNVTNVQFLVYNEVDNLSDAQPFPASTPSSGSSAAIIGTNNLSNNGAYTVVAKLSGANGWAYCSDKAYFTITSDLPPAQPQGLCNGLAGSWTDNSSDGTPATWTLTQSGNSLSGSVTVSLGSCGTATWTASGSYQGNGQFSLQATNPTDPQACGALPNVSEMITISGPGCSSGSGTWSNSNNDSGTNSWSSAASIPGQEKSNFKEWDTHGYSTEARFGAVVSASNGEQFGGRLVREQGSVSDGCWDSTSLLKPVTQVDGQSTTNAGAWAIQSDNSYGEDMIGYDPGTVLYYQQHRANTGLSMPCNMTAQQQMQIQTGSGTWQTYQANPITVTISPSSVDVKRNNADSGSLQYPYQ
jgi:hypothetical protein